MVSKWEYKVIAFPNKKNSEDKEQKLDELGETGWELVTVNFQPFASICYLKRKK